MLSVRTGQEGNRKGKGEGRGGCSYCNCDWQEGGRAPEEAEVNGIYFSFVHPLHPLAALCGISRENIRCCLFLILAFSPLLTLLTPRSLTFRLSLSLVISNTGEHPKGHGKACC